MRGTWSEWLVFGGLGIAWGSSYLFIKIGVETIPPMTLVAGRLAIGALLLAAIIAMRREALPRSGRIYGHLVVMALLSMVILFSLISIGEQTIDSALAAILNATVPLFVLIIAPLVFADERVTLGRVIGLAIGFAGVIVLVSPNIGPSFGGSLFGQVAVMGSSVSYAAGAVYAPAMRAGSARWWQPFSRSSPRSSSAPSPPSSWTGRLISPSRQPASSP